MVRLTAAAAWAPPGMGAAAAWLRGLGAATAWAEWPDGTAS